MSVKTKLARWQKMQQRIKTLEEASADLLKELQQECPHPLEAIVEAPHRSYQYLERSTPPFRVCRACGLAEEGWGCGYRLLAPRNYSSVPELSREAAQNLVKGRMVCQERSKED
jgi:hypothetical protein